MPEIGDSPDAGVFEAGSAQDEESAFPLGASSKRFAWAAIAERVAMRVGDGCVIRERETDGAFIAVAVAHRDPDHRRALQGTVGRRLRAPRGAWLRQSLASGRPMRVPRGAKEVRGDAGIVENIFAGEILVVPLVSMQAVMVVVRDRASGPFGEHESRELGRIVGEVRLMSDSGRVSGGAIAASAERELLETTSAALWLTDAEGRTEYVNQATCEMVGAPAEQIIGIPVSEFLSRPISPPPRGFDGAVEAERILIGVDGRERWVTATARRLLDESGRFSRTLHTLVDVDERHWRETALRQRADLEHEMRVLAEELLSESRVEVMAQSAVGLVADQVGAPLVVLSAISRDQNEFELLAMRARSGSVDERRWRGRLPIPECSPVRTAIEEGAPVLVRNFDGHGGYERGVVTRDSRAGSLACASIADGAASMAIIDTEPDAITVEDVDLLDAISRLLSARWPRGAFA